MRFKHRKWANPFFIVSLAIAGLFGASAAVIDNQTQETPVAEKADAADPGTFVYAKNEQSWGSLYVYAYKNSNSSIKNAEWPGTQMKQINNTSQAYYADLGSNKTQFDRIIFHNNSGVQTGNIPCNLSNHSVFKSFSQGSTYADAYALSDLAVSAPNSQNNWSTSTSVTFGTTASGNIPAHTYRLTYTFTDKNKEFKIVNSGSWWGYTSIDHGGLDKTHISKASQDSDPNCKVDCPATLKLWFTPAWIWFGNKNEIFNGNDGSVFVDVSKYTVTLNKQSGTGGSGSVTATYGSAMPSATMPTRTGYTFGGYFTETGGDGTKYYNADGSSAKNWDINENTTLYAYWIPTTFTITYDRNNAGAQSVTATRTKKYDVEHTILDPAVALSWSPSADKRFVGWADSREGTATHSAGDSYTTNAAKTFYYNEDWYNYRYKIGSGSWVNLNHNDTDKPSGVKAQFQSASAQLLSKGSLLTFQYSTDGGTNWSSLTINTFEGNYDTSTGIKDQTTDTIYLKLNDDASNKYSVWVPGVSERTIAVCNSSSASSGTYYNTRSNGYTEVVTISYVYIQKGQYLKRGWGKDLYETILDTSGGAHSYFSQVGSETAVLCNMTGAYTIYNKAGSYNNWKDVYITRSDSESAKYLAQLFNGIISPICTAAAGGDAKAALQEVWYSNTSSDMYKHFNGQPTATMDYFSGKTSSSDTDIVACITRYNYIENKYGTTALPDFFGRGGYKAAVRDFTPFELMDDGENGITTLIIIIASSISLLSITALSVLMVKKRKRKEY